MTLFLKKDLFVAIDLNSDGSVKLTAVFNECDDEFVDAAQHCCFDDSEDSSELHGEFSLTSIVTDAINLNECDKNGNMSDRLEAPFAALKAEMLKAISIIDGLTYVNCD